MQNGNAKRKEGTLRGFLSSKSVARGKGSQFGGGGGSTGQEMERLAEQVVAEGDGWQRATRQRKLGVLLRGRRGGAGGGAQRGAGRGNGGHGGGHGSHGAASAPAPAAQRAQCVPCNCNAQTRVARRTHRNVS